MSKKYIIEIEEEPFVRQSALHGEEGLYRAVGFKSLVFDKDGLKKLKPCEEVKGRLIDIDVAMEAVGTMFAPTPTQKDMVEDCLEILDNLSSGNAQKFVSIGRY